MDSSHIHQDLQDQFEGLVLLLGWVTWWTLNGLTRSNLVCSAFVAPGVYLQIGCGVVPSGRILPTLDAPPQLPLLLHSWLAVVPASCSASCWYSVQPGEA